MARSESTLTVLPGHLPIQSHAGNRPVKESRWRITPAARAFAGRHGTDVRTSQGSLHLAPAADGRALTESPDTVWPRHIALWSGASPLHRHAGACYHPAMAPAGARRGHGEDSTYFDASKNRWLGATSLGISADGQRRIRRKVRDQGRGQGQSPGTSS